MKQDRKQGGGISFPPILEGCLFFFYGVILLGMTWSGRYLSYVTPRMKPYLIGTGLCFLIWGISKYPEIWKPKYKKEGWKLLVLILPIFLFLFLKPSKDFVQWKNWSQKVEVGGNNKEVEKDGVKGQKADEKIFEETPEIPEPEGKNVAKKEIIVQEDDFYQWLLRFSYFPKEYQGYRIKIHGKTYKNEEFPENQFAITRLVMTCCVADVAPSGLICVTKEEGTVEMEEWVSAVGIFHYEKERGMWLEVEEIIPANPASKEYLYPY